MLDRVRVDTGRSQHPLGGLVGFEFGCAASGGGLDLRGRTAMSRADRGALDGALRQGSPAEVWAAQRRWLTTSHPLVIRPVATAVQPLRCPGMACLTKRAGGHGRAQP